LPEDHARSLWQAHLLRQTVAALESIPRADRWDVYVVSLLLATERNDNRRVIAVVSWNTARHLAHRRRDVHDEHLAFVCEISPYEFAGREAAIVGSAEHDPDGDRLRRAWLEDRGLWYADVDAGRAVIEKDPRIWNEFLEIVIDVARMLHHEGYLDRLLGGDRPVLIDAELEDDEDMRALNRLANPAGFHWALDQWATRHDTWAFPVIHDPPS
jgi:hypothetical protein